MINVEGHFNGGTNTYKIMHTISMFASKTLYTFMKKIKIWEFKCSLNISFSCYRKQESIALYLIEKGTNIHLLNNQNRGALHAAAYNGTIMALKVLIQKGCNPNQVVRLVLFRIRIAS